MNLRDINRRAETFHMVSVTGDTSEEVESDIEEVIKTSETLEINSDTNLDSVSEKIQDLIFQYEESEIVIAVRNYEDRTEDDQTFLAQHLKGIAEQYPDVSIIIFDEEGGNITNSNPDMRGRVYSL